MEAPVAQSLPILSMDRVMLTIFVGVLGLKELFAVCMCIFQLTKMMLSRYYGPSGCSLL